MQSMYIVVETKYEDSTDLVPTLAFESYQDASSYVNNRYGDTPVSRLQHIYTVPFVTDRDRKISKNDLHDITDIVVRALSVYNDRLQIKEL